MFANQVEGNGFVRVIRKVTDKVPIQKGEWTKFLTTALMLMLVVYVYSILRASKDAMIITLTSAELISTLKLYGTLPSAILFMLLYTKLVDMFTRIQLFHIINWFFISFFVLFAFVLFPNADKIHPDLNNLIGSMPYCKYAIIMISKWSFSLYYILSELWGSVMLSLLFWQLANQITLLAEAKRFYPLFGFMAQAGLYSSGGLMRWFTKEASSSGWNVSMIYIAISVLIAGIALSTAITVLSNAVGSDLINGKVSLTSKAPKKKVKMGFIEGLKYVMSSKYIGLIALLIICYGVSINLVEGVWKKSLAIVYPDTAVLAAYMGTIQQWTAILTAVAMLCGSFVLRLMRWSTAALLTPIVTLITGVSFFLFVVFRENFENVITTLGVTSMFLAAFFGSAQNVLSKSTKYAFFDATKEMSYIPLDEELKSKGKAAADVIGGRLGKSGGAVIQWVFVQVLFLNSSLIELAPYLFVIFTIVAIIWIIAVFALSKEFAIKSAEMETTV